MFACFRRLTIGHASLSRRSTVPTPNRDTSNIGRSLRFSHRYCVQKQFAYFYPLPVAPSVAPIYLLGQRSFSRYYLVYQTSPCHVCLLFLISNTSRSSLYISHSPTLSSTLYCFATRAHLCIFFLLPSTTGIPLSSCLLYTSPSPRDKRQSRMPSSA